jgi:hypothetical protein
VIQNFIEVSSQKLYKSSLQCKAKGPVKKRAVKEMRFFELQNTFFFSIWISLIFSKPHNFLISHSF